ncbi:MAG: AtpZ/AtpI family protein [Selenomonadaceae bacterium]|nr:AtpZ/AtpI family protein [Selenomonadaceae bacterium]
MPRLLWYLCIEVKQVKREQHATEKDSHEGLRQTWKAFSFLSGVGIYLAAVIGICVYLGNLADEHLGLGMKGKFAGILLGFPIAIYSLYRQLKHSGTV